MMRKTAIILLLVFGGLIAFEAMQPPEEHARIEPLADGRPDDVDEKDIRRTSPIEPRLLSTLCELVPDYPESHAKTVLAEYGNTALNVARRNGVVGLDGLRVLGTEGVELMRAYPDTFSQLADRLGGERSIRLLALLRDQLGDVTRKGGLPALIDRIEALEGRAARLGDRYPQFLPLLVMAPEEVADVLTLYPEIAVECLMIVDLSQGPASVQAMCDLIKKEVPKAREWFSARGADGLMLAHAYPEFVKHEPSIEMEVFLQILRNNSAYISSLRDNAKRAEALRAINVLGEADARLPVAAETGSAPTDGLRRGLLLALACEDPNTVQFVLEHGPEGIDVLMSTVPQWTRSGMSLPRTLYDAYDPALSKHAHLHAWDSLRPRETRGDAFFALQTFAPWKDLRREERHKNAMDFVRLLGETDGRFPIWAAENEKRRLSGAAGYAAADDDWAIMVSRPPLHLDQWAKEKKGPQPQEYLPLYDTCRLLYVLSSGYQPTTGEVVFATVDVAFTAWDVATFGAGAAFREGAQASSKTLGKLALEASEQAVRSAGQDVVNAGRKVQRAAG